MCRKLTKEYFIIKAKDVHGDNYDYSLVDYINNKTKVKIICPIHGEFEQIPNSHLRGIGCNKCSGNVKSDTEDFIKKSKEVHDDKYDYSLVDYKNAKTKVKINCLIHGIFEQIPNSHLSGVGCPKCGLISVVGKISSNTDEFISKSNEVHNYKYDYSLVNYINSTTKVKIICSNHGIFEQIPHSHLKGSGCSKCSGKEKLTTEEFIQKAKEVHGDKYNYTLVNYINSTTKVKIICPIHGVFEQECVSHLRGRGCFKCGGKEKLTTDYFITKSKQIHGDKYDYSLVDYKNNKSKVKIICNIHGIYEQNVQMHLNGYGCPMCNNTDYNTENFIKKSKNIHGNRYDYRWVEYNGNKTKVKIICKEHGEFAQNPNNHLNGSGCPMCNRRPKLSVEDFIIKSKKIHGDKFDYSMVDYINYNTKIKIICKKHGIFEQKPINHIVGNGCSKCNSSKGEMIIETYLKNNIIKFINQKRFKECKNKRPLPFDFYLPDYNICIEFDGRQHYEIVNVFGGKDGFNLIKKSDEIKTEYCEDKGIKLIRISYLEKDNIEEILNRELGF